MKKFLKFSGAIAFLFGLIAFILLLATAGVTFKYSTGLGDITGEAAGTVVLFGKTEKSMGIEVVTKCAPNALIAWILIILALIILCLGIILPLLKVKALDKFAGLLNLVAVIALVVAGILLFFTVLGFTGANKVDSSIVKYYHLGAGWIIAAILSILGGIVAILPVCSAFLGKKK